MTAVPVDNNEKQEPIQTFFYQDHDNDNLGKVCLWLFPLNLLLLLIFSTIWDFLLIPE